MKELKAEIKKRLRNRNYMLQETNIMDPLKEKTVLDALLSGNPPNDLGLSPDIFYCAA